MKLYYASGACSLASHIALIEAGIPFTKERISLPDHRTESGEDFYTISPRGYVPAIVTDELGLLTENSAVLAYLSEQGGDAPQGADRFKLYEWLGYIGTEIHHAFSPLFRGAEGEAKDAAHARIVERFELAAKLMNGDEWLVAGKPGVADNYLFVTTLWAKKFGVSLPSAIEAFRKRNMARPAVQQAMRDEGLMADA